MENKKNLFKNLLGIFIGFLVVLCYLFGVDFYQDQSYTLETEEVEVQVEKIIDGDTIQVRELQSDEVFNVRYLGIDTPELEGPDYESCFASQAKEKNKDLVLDKKVILEFDIDKYDRFGRTLAYVYALDEFGEKQTFVNLELLQEGYARFYLDKQNTLYEDELVQSVLAAHENFLGLWGSCGETSFDGKCVIKGNIDRLGQKYYHIPGDKYYLSTKINPLKEDKWLCTIEEAEAKNFHRALQ